MLDIQIQTYWNVSTLYNVLNGVSAAMQSSNFSGLMRYVFLTGIAVMMFATLGRQLDLAKWFIQSLIFVSVLNMPIARVALTDKTGLEPPMAVDHVPFALAIGAQAANLVFGSLTSTYETVFGVPDELGLEKGDIGFGNRILKEVNHATIQDPELRSDLLQFFKECTLYDVKDGTVSVSDLVKGADSWNTIFSNTSPARFVTYHTLSATPVTDTCDNVAKNYLKDKVDNAEQAAEVFYGKQVFTRATSDALAKEMFVNAIGSANDFILGSSQSASDSLKQAMFNAVWRDAGASLPAMMNDPALASEMTAMAGAAQAAQANAAANNSVSILAQEGIPQFRNWIEAIFYGIFPIVVVLCVWTTPEGAKKIIGGYLMILVWIGLWPVLFALINQLSLLHLKTKAASLALASGVPFQMMDVYEGTLIDEQSMIGWMIVLVPFMAAGLVKLGSGGFMGVADRLVSGFSNTATRIGENLGQGNEHIGDTAVDNHSANSTSMNKYDTNTSIMSGTSSFQMANGDIRRLSGNGGMATDEFANHMTSSMTLDNRFESASSQDSNKNDSASYGDQVVNRASNSASLTDLKGHDDNRGTDQRVGVSAYSSRQGTQSGSHSIGEHTGTSQRDSSGFSTSAGAADNIGAGVQVGSGGGSGGGSGSAPGGALSKDERRISETMRQQGASPSSIAQAIENYRGSKGQVGGRSGVGAGLDAHTGKSYSAAQNRYKEASADHGQSESAQRENSYSVTGGQNAEGSNGTFSSQTNRHATDASYTQSREHSSTHDAGRNHSESFGDRNSRTVANASNKHEDLFAKPEFWAAVANRNNMSNTRFANLPEGQRRQMAYDYVGEMESIKQTKTLPATALSGQQMPMSSNQVKRDGAKFESGLGDSTKSAYGQFVGKSGYGGTTPLKVNTAVPETYSNARGDVNTALNKQDSSSIASRSSQLQENVNAWASPDKEMGAARANPVRVLENMEGADLKDTVEKAGHVLTGGPATADGEVLSENQKRETQSTVQLGQINQNHNQ